jgi:hypothetical protein
MDYLQLLFNILLLLLWVRLWSAPSKEFYFNPFLSGTVRLTDSVFAFLRPVLNLPEAVTAVLLILFTVAFKTLLIGRMGGQWSIPFGGLFLFSQPVAGEHWGPHFLYSALHFAAFLIRFWSVFLLVKLLTLQQRTSRAAEAFAFFSRPFSRLPLLAQPAVLVVLHVALAFAVSRTGTLSTIAQVGQEAQAVAVSPFMTGPLFAQLLKTGWLAALSFADALALLTRTLFILIIGNFGAAILQAQGAAIICHEGVELLLGRFARNRAATGMGFDFTPLIFFFVVDMMYNAIRQGLFNLIQSPYFN